MTDRDVQAAENQSGTQELKPCPICKGEMIISDSIGLGENAQEIYCWCGLSFCYDGTVENAIAMFNSRLIEDELRAEIANLKAENERLKIWEKEYAEEWGKQLHEYNDMATVRKHIDGLRAEIERLKEKIKLTQESALKTVKDSACSSGQRVAEAHMKLQHVEADLAAAQETIKRLKETYLIDKPSVHIPADQWQKLQGDLVAAQAEVEQLKEENERLREWKKEAVEGMGKTIARVQRYGCVEQGDSDETN